MPVFQYAAPISMFYIYAPFVVLLAYMYYSSTRVEAEDFWTVKPEYLSELEELSVEASRYGEWYATPVAMLCLVLFYFERGISILSEKLNVVYRSKFILSNVSQLVFLLNFFEFGTCMRMCRSCHASVLTYVKYACGALLGGFTQRVSLMDEAERYVRQKIRSEKKEEFKKTKKL